MFCSKLHDIKVLSSAVHKKCQWTGPRMRKFEATCQCLTLIHKGKGFVMLASQKAARKSNIGYACMEHDPSLWLCFLELLERKRK